jgi:hypothetical protein
MAMVYRLSRAHAIIHAEIESIDRMILNFDPLFLLVDKSCASVDLSLAKLKECADMSLGNNQSMKGRHRIAIGDRIRQFVLGDFSLAFDLAE